MSVDLFPALRAARFEAKALTFSKGVMLQALRPRPRQLNGMAHRRQWAGLAVPFSPSIGGSTACT